MMTDTDLTSLDLAVAQALGWKWADVPPDANGNNACKVMVPPDGVPRDYTWPHVGRLAPEFFTPRWSRNPLQAMELAAERNMQIQFCPGRTESVFVYIGHKGWHEKISHYPTRLQAMAVAICRAIISNSE